MVMIGCSGEVISDVSPMISTIRSVEALDMVIITNTMESIIRLMRICIRYTKRLIRPPVLKPIAELLPEATIIRAPNQEINSILP